MPATAPFRLRNLRLPQILICSLLPLVLIACSKAPKPASSLEVAAVGMHSGALSDDGSYALVGSINHGGSLWRTKSDERVFNWNHKSGEYSTIIAADFSHNNQWALSATAFDLVLWNTQSGQGERFWSTPGEILDAELGPNARFALLGLSDHTAVIFDIRRGGVLQTLPHENRVRSVDLSNAGTLALTGSEDYSVSLWNTQTGKKIRSLQHEDDVQLVKLSPDGSLALSVSKYDKAIIWQTDDGKVLGELPLGKEKIKRGLRLSCAKFSQDNTRLLTGRADEEVQLWDVQSQRQIKHWQLPKRDAWKPTGAAVIDLSFSQHGDTFYALASNGFLHKLTGSEKASSQ